MLRCTDELAPGGPAAIAVDRLGKRRRGPAGERFVVRGLSLRVGQGEALALLGRNGAGKSTTLRMLATLLAPDEGTMTIGGRDVVREPATVRTMIGVALQDSCLPRRQSARRLLRHHGRLFGLSERAALAQAEETIAEFSLEAVADRSIETYSGGERRRLHLALALLHEPAVILLDEPTVGLDASAREIFWGHLGRRRRAGAAVLFATHDLSEAEEHAQRVAVIEDEVAA